MTRIVPVVAAEVPGPVAPQSRKPWKPPVIEDADIRAITAGNGTSGIEGPAFLKPGS